MMLQFDVFFIRLGVASDATCFYIRNQLKFIFSYDRFEFTQSLLGEYRLHVYVSG